MSASEFAIEVRGLVKRRGERRVLDGASLAVRRGEVAVLIGPSGGGKSTLLRCINGLESADEGEIRVLGERVPCGLAHDAPQLVPLRRRVGMVFQQFHLFAHLSALENVMSGPLWVRGEPRETAREQALALLRRVGLEARAGARPRELSGGEQQRVAIARALALRPELLLFDEPTSALDPTSSREVLAVMEELARAGQTMLVVTHAMEFARAAATTLHVLEAGRVVESRAAL
ncbi:MAG: amino acid ABC transporter ATP-binding protein [Planctomycetota bacterium]|nr:MAG: amino acid ABC transporter ATP-binding protein [Planctomycetota bacterium]